MVEVPAVLRNVFSDLFPEQQGAFYATQKLNQPTGDLEGDRAMSRYPVTVRYVGTTTLTAFDNFAGDPKPDPNPIFSQFERPWRRRENAVYPRVVFSAV